MSRNHQERISETRLKASNRKENEALTTRQRIIKYLTLAQRCSAPFLSVYIGIHLSAPIAANFGGSALSTKMMVRANRRVCISTDETDRILQLLGREYYQGNYTEYILLWIPLGIHVGSSLTRRFLLGLPKRPALVTVAAYGALIPVLLHAGFHRILPSSPAPPISSLSPSELDYEFVKTGFSAWPVFTWTSYMTLVSVVLLHAAEGASIITRYFTGYAPTKLVRRSIAALTTSAVFFGLYRIYQEPLQLRGLQLDRVMSVYRQSPVYTYVF
jgi:hypothetical protein